MLLLLLWRHADYYINGTETETDATHEEQGNTNLPSGAGAEADLSQTARPALSESRGWGISLFSPFRRKAESPAPSSGAIGVPLVSSTLGGGSGAYGQNSAGLGRSVLTVSALGSGGRRLGGARGPEGREAEIFKTTLGAVLEPVFERLGSLQLVGHILFLWLIDEAFF
jgi:hypothetical protein